MSSMDTATIVERIKSMQRQNRHQLTIQHQLNALADEWNDAILDMEVRALERDFIAVKHTLDIIAKRITKLEKEQSNDQS